MPNTFTASHSPRCLYHDSLRNFCAADETLVFGKLCENYHGEALTTTRDAWIGELAILKQVLSRYSDREGQIIFEYDIPRLGKRVDAVLLLDGVVFCLEFKVGVNREFWRRMLTRYSITHWTSKISIGIAETRSSCRF